MTVKEAYAIMDADYDDAIGRLLSDARIYKYNKKFEINEDYKILKKSLDEKDYETAFRMAHNLKGMCLNLSFKGLHEVSDIICEELRGGNPGPDVYAMFDKVTEKYDQVMAGIALMEEA